MLQTSKADTVVQLAGLGWVMLAGQQEEMNTELYIKCWTKAGEMQFSMFFPTQFCRATEVWGVGMFSGYGKKIPNASALNQSLMLTGSGEADAKGMVFTPQFASSTAALDPFRTKVAT